MLNNKLLPIVLVAVLLGLAGFGPGGVLHAADEPVMTLTPERFDFGEILSGAEIEKAIRIENRGTADLCIQKVQFSCGCTLPEMVLSNGEKREPDLQNPDSFVILKPGEWADVKLIFQTIGKFGEVTHRMDLYSNDPEGQLVSIPIHAQVRRAFTLEPARVDFGVLDKQATASRTVTVTAHEVGDFKITGIEKLPPYLTYSVEDKEGAETPTQHLTVNYVGGAPAGQRTARLKVQVENKLVKDFAVIFTMRVFPAVVFVHEDKRIFNLIDLGLLKRGEEKTAELQIINTNPKQPVHITDWLCRSRCKPKVKAEFCTEEEGVKYRVKLSVSPEVTGRMVNGTLFLETDHPDLPKTAIRFRGIYGAE